MIIQDTNGNDVDVFCRDAGGMIEAMVRAPNEETFNAVALSVGLIGEDGNGVGGIDVCRVGLVEKTPAVEDTDGSIISPAIYYPDYHVNLKLGAKATAKGAWKKWAITWSTTGSDATPHNSEAGKTLNGVTLIDPDTVSGPAMVWG